jgi:hypothetical protein
VQHFGLVPAILHQQLVITYNSILKASFIMPSSESTSLSSPLVADGHGATVNLKVVLKMVIGEKCGPLGLVGVGCQALPAHELLGTARGLEMLLTELFIVALAKVGLLQVANLNVDGRDFFVEVMESGDVSGDTPIIELSSRCNHGKELGVRAVDDGSEPTWECFDGLVSGVGRGGIDRNDVGRVLGPIMGREGSDFAIVETFDPFCGEVEAGCNGNLKQQEFVVFHISFWGIFVDFLVLADFVTESSNLVSEAILNSPVCVLPILAGLDEAMDNAAEDLLINVDVASNDCGFG